MMMLVPIIPASNSAACALVITSSLPCNSASVCFPKFSVEFAKALNPPKASPSPGVPLLRFGKLPSCPYSWTFWCCCT